MIVIPAIDLLDGKAVRLRQGDYDQVTVYNEDPADQARRFAEAGAEWLHVVDLDGARSGRPVNLDAVARITQAFPGWVDLGGGLRTLDDIDAAFDIAVDRFVLGTALVRDPELALAAVAAYPGRVIAGVDARDGMVSIQGWREGTSVPALEFMGELWATGIKRLIYTDISRDGMGSGIDVAAYAEIARESDMSVVASGGVATLDDIRALRASGAPIEGVIVGRALYEGAFTLEEAIAAGKGL
jgi:phosphoribosylformimino-5-aminoimidazole carboxamide ribotide isomerase